jgi:hypothetical protein
LLAESIEVIFGMKSEGELKPPSRFPGSQAHRIAPWWFPTLRLWERISRVVEMLSRGLSIAGTPHEIP